MDKVELAKKLYRLLPLLIGVVLIVLSLYFLPPNLKWLLVSIISIVLVFYLFKFQIQFHQKQISLKPGITEALKAERSPIDESVNIQAGPIPGKLADYIVESWRDPERHLSAVSLFFQKKIPVTFILRRVKSHLGMDNLVSNTPIDGSTIEYELLPLRTGIEAVDNHYRLGTNNRSFLVRVITEEASDVVSALLTSELVYIIEISFNGKAITFMFQPHFDTLSAPDLLMLLDRMVALTQYIELSVEKYAELLQT